MKWKIGQVAKKRGNQKNPKSLGSFAALKDVDAIPQISEIETIEILTFVKDQT